MTNTDRYGLPVALMGAVILVSAVLLDCGKAKEPPPAPVAELPAPVLVDDGDKEIVAEVVATAAIPLPPQHGCAPPMGFKNGARQFQFAHEGRRYAVYHHTPTPDGPCVTMLMALQCKDWALAAWSPTCPM